MGPNLDDRKNDNEVHNSLINNDQIQFTFEAVSSRKHD